MIRKDILLAIMVVFLWSLNGVFTKYSVVYLSPCFLNFIRFLLLAPLVFFVPFPKAPIINLILISLTWFMGTLLMLTLAYQEGLPVGLGGFLQQSSVVFSVIISLFVFKEIPKKNQIIGLAISIIGLTYIILMRSHSVYISEIAMCYGLLSGVFMAIGITMIKKQTKKNDSLVVIWYSAFSVIPAGVTLFFQNEKSIRIDVSERDVIPVLILIMLYGSFIAILYANKIWYNLIGRNTSALLNPFLLLSPIFSIVLSFLLLGEVIDIHVLIGGSLMIVGLTVNNKKDVAHLTPLATADVKKRRVVF